MDDDAWLFVRCLAAALVGLAVTRLVLPADGPGPTIGIAIVVFLALTAWHEYRVTVRS